jgi:hypothetical protein
MPPTTHKVLNKLKILASLEGQIGPTDAIRAIKW